MKRVIAISAILFAFLLFINIMLPPQSDDIRVMQSVGFESAKNSYFHWNGRIGELLHFGFFGGVNPYIFDVINAGIGVIFILCFFVLVFGRIPRDFKDISTIALIIFILMKCCAFGADFAFMSGSLNYLWGICLIIIFLLPYRFALNNQILFSNFSRFQSVIFASLFVIIGFFAGMASEQIGILTIISIFCLNAFICYRRFCHKDFIKLPIIFNVAFLFFIVGWLVLYLSPGHTNRASGNVEFMNLPQLLSLNISELAERILKAVMNFNNDILMIFSLLLLALWIFKGSINAEKIAIFGIVLVAMFVANEALQYFWIVHLLVIGIVLFVLAQGEIGQKYFALDSRYFYVSLLMLFVAFCVCSLSMIQVLSLPHRARLGDSMILIAMVAIVWDSLANVKILQRGIILLSALYAIFVASAFVEYRLKWNDMVAYIEQSKARGERHIEVDYVYFYSFYENLVGWNQPTHNTNLNPNPQYAKYFGVDSFKVK